jgi:hypothetical protein
MFHILSFICFALVRGWGGDGHSVITSLATEVMSKDSRRFLLNALDDEDDDLARASVWADTREAEMKYPLSGAYHFSNTPYRKCGGFEYERDCGFGRNKGICIVTGLSEAISRAVDINISDSVRSDALKFILHLMGDIHQPLHTGFRADSGGVRIVLGEPRDTSLHYVWDNWMLDEMRRRSNETVETVLQNQLSGNGNRFATSMRAKINMTDILSSEAKIFAFVASLASETATTVTCNSGYKLADGKWIGGQGAVIDGSYFEARQPVLVVQLLKAAVRLGILMDGISEQVQKQKKSAKEKRRVELFAATSYLASKTLKNSNPFEELYVELDPNSAVIVADEVATIKPVRRITTSVVTRVNETELLETAIRESESEKLSYTFSGVDLSQVRLLNFRGYYLVSNETLAKLMAEDSRRMYSRIVLTASNDGSVKRTNYYFDGELFPEHFGEELVVRVMLKLSGVDPRIDITDYLETFRRPLIPEKSAAWTAIAETLGSRVMESIESLETDVLMKRITDMGSKMIYHELADNTVGIVHTETIDTWSTNTPMIRFTKMVYFLGAERSIYVFIDPKIIDKAVRAKQVPLIVKTMKNVSKLYSSRRSPRIFSHIIWREITEISQQHQYQNRQLGVCKDSTHIQWVFDFELEGGEGQDQYSLAVIHAVRKGFFNSTDELHAYINSTDPSDRLG